MKLLSTCSAYVVLFQYLTALTQQYPWSLVSPSDLGSTVHGPSTSSHQQSWQDHHLGSVAAVASTTSIFNEEFNRTTLAIEECCDLQLCVCITESHHIRVVVWLYYDGGGRVRGVNVMRRAAS